MPRLPASAIAVPLALAACTPSEAPPEPSTSTGAPAAATSGASAMPATPGPRSVGTGEPAPSAAPTGADACGASKVRDRWLNALPSAEVKADIAARVGERRTRYYTDGDPITMDYSEERLNVVLGKDGRIKEFRCG